MMHLDELCSTSTEVGKDESYARETGAVTVGRCNVLRIKLCQKSDRVASSVAANDLHQMTSVPVLYIR
jgi:hypothetical protein